MIRYIIIYICFLVSFSYAAHQKSNENNSIYHPWSSSMSYNTTSSVYNTTNLIRAVNEFPRPNNPMLDRAFGYLLKGKAQAALTNYGRFVDWDYHPPGLWGNYTYLPSVAFVAGVPGQSYTYLYTDQAGDGTWVEGGNQNCPESSFFENGDQYTIWCSEEAYYDDGKIEGFSWYENEAPIFTTGDENNNFVSIVFDSIQDGGTLGDRLCSPYQLIEQENCIGTFDERSGCFEEGTDSCGIETESMDEWNETVLKCYNECYDRCLLCQDDDGIIIEESCQFTDKSQFCVDDVNEQIIISLPNSTLTAEIDPNNSDVYDTGEPLGQGTGVGFVYPWAMRPDLDKRLDDFDLYKYGDDAEEWTRDDDYVYYGANVAESWFSNWRPSANTDWHASSDSRINTHQTTNNENDFFHNIPYLELTNKPVLAHSEYKDTWPQGYNSLNEYGPIWPGWNADKYDPRVGKYGDGCDPEKRWNDECWVQTDPLDEQFISDNDVYMEFDDRWAHRGNLVSNNEYQQTGYPMGLRVMAEAHSYGIEFAEDILFVTVQVRNESGDNWCAWRKVKDTETGTIIEEEVLDYAGNPICGDAMIMPDGTKINGGKGFTYKGTSMGFYMDADVVTSTKRGSFGVHSNDDDFMEYYDCALTNDCDFVNDDFLRVSIAMIYDYDGQSNSASDIGIVATQLLDSPYATEEIKLADGITIPAGNKLKMTDWHWFSWYARPGVVNEESNAGVSAGYPGGDQARNKEEIQYKIIRGDTTNLSVNEKKWYFHTDTPAIDDHDNNLNPHFDSLDGLLQTSFFTTDPDGLDCVLMMSSGPFSIEVGEQVPFSFCLIWGQNKNDLLKNAKFAQLMYNSHYQGYQGPTVPTLTAEIGEENDEEGNQHHCINLSWDSVAENSVDVVTGYSDFEGYKLYRSEDGGLTWGDSKADLYDYNNPDSWLPLLNPDTGERAIFHLTKEQDEKHCTYANDYHGECSISKPSYYIHNSCLSECENTGIPYDCKRSANSYTSEWIDCIDNACGTCLPFSEDCFLGDGVTPCDDQCQEGVFSTSKPISSKSYRLLKDDEKLEYTPYYEEVDCNISPWCIGETCEDATIHHVRAYDVCGQDKNYPEGGSSFLGECHDGSIPDEEIGLQHSYRDCNVTDGIEYTYTVTAYDTGIPTEFISTFNETYGVYNQSENSANPLGFAAPSGYKSISSSKGRSANDKNFVTVESGASATRNLSDMINVVPNPYIVHSQFSETEYTRKIRFTHLPEKCKITIYTISGEKVVSFTHDDPEDGNAWWNVRTLNNQEVAPGLYVFTVENLVTGYEHEKFVGKFAIIR